MNRTLRRASLPAAALALALGLSACSAANEASGDTDAESSLSGTLNGAGASSQEAAVGAWKQGFQTDNADVTVNYDPVGSGGGREQFIAGGVAFAGTDSAFDEEETAAAAKKCASDLVEVPTYVSPIAVIYNLEGVEDLQLSPQTIGGIFQGTIRTWDDAAIKADNPDATLPSTKITPVHRSDDSGTTKNFTDYLDQASEGGWKGGVVETWPVKGGEAAEGTSGVVQAVGNGTGTIGYADASQAGELGTVNVKVGEEYVGPTAEAAAAILDASEQADTGAETQLVFELNRTTTEAGVYPIVLVSYMATCLDHADDAQGELAKGWFEYVTGEDGQKAAAESAGSAPLSDSVSEQVAEIVAKIS